MKQLEFKQVGGWGGKRKRAGRKNLSGKLSHLKRPAVNFDRPLLITHKLLSGCPSLRTPHMHKVFKRFVQRAKKQGFHVIHYSLLSNHFHLLVEAESARALANGMRSLAGSLARALKRTSNKCQFFVDRYHVEVITNPTQMKNVLKYVLFNFCKHANREKHIDRYSSAAAFEFMEDLVAGLAYIVEQIAELSSPQSWLARTGWRRGR